MLRDLLAGLAAWGVPDHRIHYEAFGPATIAAVVSPTTRRALEPALVSFARTGAVARWRPGAGSLLELAEDAGARIPFGCRVGSCGTCATRVLAGAVDYAHEPDAPAPEGHALLCVAHPDGDVRLDA